MYCLAEFCNYDALRDEMIRDRIVVGVRDSELSEKMQLKTTLTLETAVKMACENESVKRQQQVVRSEQDSKTANLDTLGAKPKTGKIFKKSRNPGYMVKQTTKQNSVPETFCQRCGGPPHPKQECRAIQAVCYKCSRRGHFSRVCNTKGVSEVEAEQIFSADCMNDVFLGEIYGDSENTNEQWRTDISVNGTKVNFKLDSGADVSVISEEIYNQLNSATALQKPDKKLFGPCKTPLKCVGKFKARLKTKEQACEEEIYVVTGLDQPLLGRSACHELRKIARVRSVELKDSAEKFPKLFRGLGCVSGEYEIQLDENVEPYNLTGPRGIPIPLLPKVKEEIERMERK